MKRLSAEIYARRFADKTRMLSRELAGDSIDTQLTKAERHRRRSEDRIHE